jgi:hypothetical protein
MIHVGATTHEIVMTTRGHSGVVRVPFETDEDEPF